MKKQITKKLPERLDRPLKLGAYHGGGSAVSRATLGIADRNKILVLISPPLLFAFPFPLICLPSFSSFYFPPTFISFFIFCSPFLFLLLNFYYSLHSFFSIHSFLSPRPFPHSFLLCAYSATCLCYTHIPIIIVRKV